MKKIVIIFSCCILATSFVVYSMKTAKKPTTTQAGCPVITPLQNLLKKNSLTLNEKKDLIGYLNQKLKGIMVKRAPFSDKQQKVVNFVQSIADAITLTTEEKDFPWNDGAKRFVTYVRDITLGAKPIDVKPTSKL